MTPLAWCIILLILGLFLLIMEVFVPSGGVLGLLAVGSVLASILLAYYHYGPFTGTIFLAAGAISVPGVVVLAVKFWPHTPLGRLILIPLPKREDPMLRDTPHVAGLKALLGSRGTARSPLLPAGAVSVAGKVYDALSQSGPIDPGEEIEVVGLSGPSLLVRRAAGASPTAPPRDTADRDTLDRPVDAVLDPFRDPPA